MTNTTGLDHSGILFMRKYRENCLVSHVRATEEPTCSCEWFLHVGQYPAHPAVSVFN